IGKLPCCAGAAFRLGSNQRPCGTEEGFAGEGALVSKARTEPANVPSLPVYVVAATHPWNHTAFERYSAQLAADWRLVTTPGELTAEWLEPLAPRFIFV